MMTNRHEIHSVIEPFKGPGLRFGMVGASLTLVDLALFQLLANVFKVSVFGIPSEVCAIWIGTAIVITLNFFISHQFVWQSTTSKRRAVIPFFGLNLFSGVVVQSIIIAITVGAISRLDWLALDSSITNLIAKCIAVGMGMILNFFGAKWLFKA